MKRLFPSQVNQRTDDNYFKQQTHRLKDYQTAASEVNSTSRFNLRRDGLKVENAFAYAAGAIRPVIRRPNAASNAVSYAKHFSRSRDAVIRIYDEVGIVIETHEQFIFGVRPGAKAVSQFGPDR